MGLFVEINSVEKNCKVILNMDEVVEITPLVSGGYQLNLTDGRIYKVTDNYPLFQQFAMQTVSADDIAKQVTKLKGKTSAPLDIPTL